MALFIVSQSSFAQTTAPVEEPHVVMVKLHPPQFPAMANQARIGGDVELKLTIGRDGTLESVAIVSGQPILGRAAVESATQSQFECRACTWMGRHRRVGRQDVFIFGSVVPGRYSFFNRNCPIS